MSISFDEFKAIIGRIKDALLERPKTKLFLEDIARAADIDIKTAEAVYDVLDEITTMLFDVEVEREIRGKFLRYYPDDDDDDIDDEDIENDDDEEDEI
ncbi:MAG: hypothetical protein Q6373_005095 [Candidatus Sigynarchaeota archaeon]